MTSSGPLSKTPLLTLTAVTWNVGVEVHGVSLPRVREVGKRFLTHWQVHELAEACREEYRLVVLFLAYTGLRWVRWRRSGSTGWTC